MKRWLAIVLSLALGIGVVACSKNEEVKNEDVTGKVDYNGQYTTLYNDYIGPLGSYSMYQTPDLSIEYYNTNEYPGNEKYVSDVKDSYIDSKEKIQTFVNSLKNDLKTEDKDIAKMNENLIAEGEKTIANIDNRIAKLDKLPKDIYSKSKEDFIKSVDEATKLEENTKTNFNQMLEDMNKKLNIEVKNTQPNK
ncbi:hypothetical protein [Romboutsia sp.]|uniref:hypothetical protein n=1 Tax=Romboutsia sp. TaxID=1965302 RepID=UPI003F371C13